MKRPCVYIMTNKRNGTLYVGVTSDLVQRAGQHKQGDIKGFTADYDCKTLVWFEPHEQMETAILREKQIKGGSRNKKLLLIEAVNPEWNDLYDQIL